MVKQKRKPPENLSLIVTEKVHAELPELASAFGRCKNLREPSRQIERVFNHLNLSINLS